MKSCDVAGVVYLGVFVVRAQRFAVIEQFDLVWESSVMKSCGVAGVVMLRCESCM